MTFDRNRGAKRARQAREAFGLDKRGPVPDLLDVIEDDAQLPVVGGWWPGGMAGAVSGDVLLLHLDERRERTRFTLAHELGHVRCGHDGALPVETSETLGGTRLDAREIEANAFAAEFLVPTDDVRGFDPRLDEVVRFAADFGVSASTALHRWRALDLLSPPHFERLRGQLDEGLHHVVFEDLGCEPFADRLEETVPVYLSPELKGGQLDLALHGEITVDGALARAVAHMISPAARP